ncbi:MAG: hypothetical protein M0Q87_10650, partial [Ottowia sp.]|nr:hypothetical protein [Ottowia sp.]
MKVWRQAFSVQREPTTPNARRSTLNLPIIAAQPQSSMRQQGHPSCATPNAQRQTPNAQRSTPNAQPPHHRGAAAIIDAPARSSVIRHAKR